MLEYAMVGAAVSLVTQLLKKHIQEDIYRLLFVILLSLVAGVATVLAGFLPDVWTEAGLKVLLVANSVYLVLIKPFRDSRK